MNRIISPNFIEAQDVAPFGINEETFQVHTTFLSELLIGQDHCKRFGDALHRLLMAREISNLIRSFLRHVYTS